MSSYPAYHPIPGGSGILTITQVTGSYISFSWVRASDDATPYEDLQYKVVISTSSNVGNPADAEANGTTVVDWADDYTMASATSLTKGTTYYLNTLVRDLNGFISAYTMVSAATL